jgi:lysophospholipid acyltransferase (LPLAT)-like uncharacterized protein
LNLSIRTLTRSDTVRGAVAALLASYLRLVWRTNRFAYQPADFFARLDAQLPVIVTFWHGQHFLTSFIRRDYPAKVLISRHGDGDINARAVERLGMQTIRGSGDHGTEFMRKGAVGAFKEMLRSLRGGISMALTADVPKRARVAGLGIIMLARQSGRPILPLAVATSRFKRLRNWDATTIHLPFGRGAMVLGEPIYVAPDSDDTVMEMHRLKLEAAMDDVTRRAYAMVGRPDAAVRAVDV